MKITTFLRDIMKKIKEKNALVTFTERTVEQLMRDLETGQKKQKKK